LFAGFCGAIAAAFAPKSLPAKEFDPKTGYMGRGYHLKDADIPAITVAMKREGWDPFVPAGTAVEYPGMPSLIPVYLSDGSKSDSMWFGYTREINGKQYTVAYETTSRKRIL
jgi:hypothetical protein